MAVVVRLGEKRILKGAREGLEASVAEATGGKRERDGEDAGKGKKAKVFK